MLSEREGLNDYSVRCWVTVTTAVLGKREGAKPLLLLGERGTKSPLVMLRNRRGAKRSTSIM